MNNFRWYIQNIGGQWTPERKSGNMPKIIAIDIGEGMWIFRYPIALRRVRDEFGIGAFKAIIGKMGGRFIDGVIAGNPCIGMIFTGG